MRVIVVGAGVIGAAVADALASRGAGVTVLEMRSPGRGASQASAGLLAPYVEGHDNVRLLELGVRSLAMFDGFAARLVEATGEPIQYARTGTLEIALDVDDAVRLHERKVWLDSQGTAAEWMDEEVVREFEPSVTPTALGGLFTEIHGFIGVHSLVRALVVHAKAMGASFEAPAEVVSVDPGRHEVEVVADGRRSTADAVVLAAGAWSRRVRVGAIAALPVRPIRGQLLHLQWCESDPPARVVWGPRCYTVPWSDGSLLVGATVEDVGFDEGTTVTGVQALTTAVTELLPHATGARIDAIRVGLRPALPDDLPAIGPFAGAPNVIAATGHFRNGILLAPLTADLVARYVLDGVADPVFRLTSPDRFGT